MKKGIQKQRKKKGKKPLAPVFEVPSVWDRIADKLLLPILSRKPNPRLDCIVDKCANRWPLSDEDQDVLDEISRREHRVIRCKLRYRKKLRLRQRQQKKLGGDHRLQVPLSEVPDVRAILQQIDKRYSGVNANEQMSPSIGVYDEEIMPGHFEDGVTYELLKRAGMTTRCCIQLGCGQTGGSAGFLVLGADFRGLFIDSNEEHAGTLRGVLEPTPSTVLIPQRIERDSVQSIIAEAGFSGEIDFLGIDLEGMEWWIWNAIDAVSPRVVCVAFNAIFGDTEAVTIPYQERYSRKERNGKGHWLHPKGFYGASLGALERLGSRKGYRLVGTASRSEHAYFIRHDLAPEIPAVDVKHAYHPPSRRGAKRLREWFIEEGLWTSSVFSLCPLKRVRSDGTASR